MKVQNLDNLSEAEIVVLASEGNKLAMEKLYRKHYALLLNFGLKYYADRDLIKDCIQEVFVNCLCKPHVLKNVTYVRAWFLASLKNEIFDRLKSIKPYSSLEDISFSDLSDESFLTYNAADLNDDEIRNRKTLINAFRQLTSNQRMAVFLHYVKGMSHQEVSAYLDMNAQSSRNLLFRAMSKMRAIMKDSVMFMPVLLY